MSIDPTAEATEEYADDELQVEELALQILDQVASMDPPLPWTVASQLELMQAGESLAPPDGRDLIVLGGDGSIVGRVSHRYPVAAELIANTGRVMLNVAKSVHKMYGAVDLLLEQLLAIHDEQRALLDGGPYSPSTIVYNLLNDLRELIAIHNDFDAIALVSQNQGSLVSHLNVPGDNGEHWIWGVWSIEDPSVHVHYWVSGYKRYLGEQVIDGELWASLDELKSMWMNDQNEKLTFQDAKALTVKIAHRAMVQADTSMNDTQWKLWMDEDENLSNNSSDEISPPQ